MSRYAGSVEIDGGLRALYIVGADFAKDGERWIVWRTCGDGRTNKARRMTKPRTNIVEAGKDLARLLAALGRAGWPVDFDYLTTADNVPVNDILACTNMLPPEWVSVLVGVQTKEQS